MELAAELLAACRVLDGERLTDAFGHISARDGERVLLTPRVGPGLVRSETQLISATTRGELRGGPRELAPNEAPVHFAMFASRQELTSVCRFHGAACLAYSTLRRPLPPVLGLSLALGGEVPVFETERTVVSAEQARMLAQTIGEGWAVLLSGFGAVTVGRTVAEAVVLAWALERSAAAALATEAGGPPRSFAASQAAAARANETILAEQIDRAWNYLKARWVDT